MNRHVTEYIDDGMTESLLSYKEARTITSKARLHLKKANQSYLRAARFLRQGYDGKIWAALGLASFREWCETVLHIEATDAYGLAQVDAFVTQFPKLRGQIEKIGKSKAKRLVNKARWDRTKEKFDLSLKDAQELTDAAEELSFVDFSRFDLARGAGDPDPAPEMDSQAVTCPHCGVVLEANMKKGSIIFGIVEAAKRLAGWEHKDDPGYPDGMQTRVEITEEQRENLIQ